MTIVDRDPGVCSLRSAVVLTPGTVRARSGHGSRRFQVRVVLIPGMGLYSPSGSPQQCYAFKRIRDPEEAMILRDPKRRP